MEKLEELVAAHFKASGCGLSLSDGTHVACDDPRIPDEFRCGDCDCREGVRAVLTCLLDNPTMSRDTRRYLEAFLKGAPDNEQG